MEWLKDIGFNNSQIKIIEALIFFNNATAVQITKKTKLPANKVYQMLKNMVLENIVYENNSSPKVYGLIDFDSFVKNKIVEKQKKVFKLENEYDNFLEKYSKPQMSEEFWILKDLDALLIKINEVYDNLESESIGLIETWVARYSTLKTAKKAIKRGKRIRFMGCVNKKNHEIVKKWLSIGVEIRNIDGFKKAGISVFDNKFVKISVEQNKLKSIWSENESLAKILKDYMEILWKKGESITLENLKKFE